MRGDAVESPVKEFANATIKWLVSKVDVKWLEEAKDCPAGLLDARSH